MLGRVESEPVVVVEGEKRIVAPIRRKFLHGYRVRGIGAGHAAVCRALADRPQTVLQTQAVLSGARICVVRRHIDDIPSGEILAVLQTPTYIRRVPRRLVVARGRGRVPRDYLEPLIVPRGTGLVRTVYPQFEPNIGGCSDKVRGAASVVRSTGLHRVEMHGPDLLHVVSVRGDVAALDRTPTRSEIGGHERRAGKRVFCGR